MKLARLLAIASLACAMPALAQTETASTIPLSSPLLASSWVISNKPISAYRLSATSGPTAGFFMVFDSATPPPDGPVVPKFCRPLAPGSNVSLVFISPVRFNVGLTLVFSTTGCYTKTASATAFFEASPK